MAVSSGAGEGPYVLCVHCHRDPVTEARCPSCGEDPRLEARYQLHAHLGSGGHAALYAGRDDVTGQPVAIKERGQHGPMGEEDVRRFRCEADLLRQLRHPGIPSYVDAFVSGRGRARRSYLVQELVDGVSLDEELKTRRYDEDAALQVLSQVAEILSYLHQLSPPVVHRDLKPGNIMRSSEGRLVLVDFGAAQDGVPETLTPFSVAGTFGYMAPEQFEGDARPASDVYGLGATLVALLGRREPQAILRAGRLPRVGVLNVSPRFLAVLERMLDPDPERRPAAEALLREVERLRASPPLVEAEPTRFTHESSHVRTRDVVSDVVPATQAVPSTVGSSSQPWSPIIWILIVVATPGSILTALLSLSTMGSSKGIEGPLSAWLTLTISVALSCTGLMVVGYTMWSLSRGRRAYRGRKGLALTGVVETMVARVPERGAGVAHGVLPGAAPHHKEGVRSSARVLSVVSTGRTFGPNFEVRIVLEVELDPPIQVELIERVGSPFAPELRPGTRVTVRLDADRPERAYIER